MSFEMWQVVVGALAVTLGPSGAAWLTVKVTLNGAREDIRQTKQDVGEIRKDVVSHGERLARIETKLENRP